MVCLSIVKSSRSGIIKLINKSLIFPYFLVFFFFLFDTLASFPLSLSLSQFLIINSKMIIFLYQIIGIFNKKYKKLKRVVILAAAAASN